VEAQRHRSVNHVANTGIERSNLVMKIGVRGQNASSA